MRNICKSVLLAVIVTGVFSFPVYSLNYFVDSSLGNDGVDGLTESTAWKTFSKVNSETFLPGDIVHLKRGEIWREQLTINQLGSIGLPITYTSYGDTRLPRPIIRATNEYSEWTEVNLLSNASFEQLYQPPSDPFLFWREHFDSSFGSLIERDDSENYVGSYSVHLNHQGGSQTYLRTSTIEVDDNTQYKLSFANKNTLGTTLKVRVRIKLEDDTYQYLDLNEEWQSTFSASYDRPFTNQTWSKQSEIIFETLPNSASINIYFFNRDGTGSVWLDDTYFDKVVTGAGRIWQGYIPEFEQTGAITTGAVLNNQRLAAHPDIPRLDDRSNPQLNLLQNGEFHAPKPTNLAPFIYYRQDVLGVSGKPSVLEVGMRDRAIKVTGASYITISDIDSQGPTQRLYTAGFRRYLVEITGNSDNIIIEDMDVTLSYGIGLIVEGGSTNNLLTGINSYDHSTTCTYFWDAGTGNAIKNSQIYDCGTLSTDPSSADKGLIGVFQTKGVTIENCKLWNNGYAGTDNIDAAISIVQATDARVLRNTILDAGGVAIQFAEGSDDCEASYNIINGWATKGGIYGEGIRIGGGSVGTKNCLIQNNLLINGQANVETNNGNTYGEWGALAFRRYQTHSNTIVRNNIFYNSNEIYEIKVEVGAVLTGSVFSNNIYYRTTGDAVNWLGTVYAFDEIIGGSSGFYSFDESTEQNSLATDPLMVDVVTNDFHLTATSPAINAGIANGLSQDYELNPIVGLTDIGPFEFLPDADGDGLSDVLEIAIGTDPNNPDSDGDSLTDGFEVAFGGNVNLYDPLLDLNPLSSDTDGDSFNDDIELTYNSDPLVNSSVPATGDLNEDGVVNAADVLLAHQISLGMMSPSASQLIRGNVAPLINGAPVPDGVLNAADAAVITRKALGLVSF